MSTNSTSCRQNHIAATLWVAKSIARSLLQIMNEESLPGWDFRGSKQWLKSLWSELVKCENAPILKVAGYQRLLSTSRLLLGTMPATFTKKSKIFKNGPQPPKWLLMTPGCSKGFTLVVVVAAKPLTDANAQHVPCLGRGGAIKNYKPNGREISAQ